MKTEDVYLEKVATEIPRLLSMQNRNWLVEQYNRNRPIEEHIKIAQEIENE